MDASANRHQCDGECHASLLEPDFFRLLEDEDEVVAEEGDQEVVKMSDEWGSKSTEKCCKCKSGSVAWSASGRCSPCRGQVAKTTSVSEECKKNSPKFMGNKKCAKACRSKLESGWSWLQENAEDEDEVVAEEGDQEVVKMSDEWGSKSTEKCCKCKSGSVAWSASGRCSPCRGQVAKTTSVSEECKKNSPKFMGNKKCAKACRSKLESGWSWLQENAEDEDEVVAEEGDQEVVKMSDEWGSKSTEKCCKCKSGSVAWSASGRCSPCRGQVAKTTSVSEECKKNSPKFMGNKKCAKACRSKLESGWSWLQENAEDEDEVVAEEGDQEVVKMSDEWGSKSTEKCCKCKSGSVAWSASGRCSPCRGQVAKTTSVSEECKKNSPKFMGNKKCAKACRSKLESGWSWLQENAEDEDEVVAEEGDQEVVKMSDEWGSKSTEKCCKCKSGSVAWSASGRCSPCRGQVAKTTSVSEECKKNSPKFMGNKKCAKACRSKLESGWSWLQENAENF